MNLIFPARERAAMIIYVTTIVFTILYYILLSWCIMSDYPNQFEMLSAKIIVAVIAGLIAGTVSGLAICLITFLVYSIIEWIFKNYFPKG